MKRYPDSATAKRAAFCGINIKQYAANNSNTVNSRYPKVNANAIYWCLKVNYQVTVLFLNIVALKQKELVQKVKIFNSLIAVGLVIV